MLWSWPGEHTRAAALLRYKAGQTLVNARCQRTASVTQRFEKFCTKNALNLPVPEVNELYSKSFWIASV
ncbi:MAG: hypothetical protein CMI09_15695 [Oceanospirillaceae bacterium]|nr:hypothetical protein [Oceanospirillaceae bacterium]|tara:strand:- start:1162 stop:1368 length:207 start_codon:yes stop_codon:yes gene_type:complete